MELQTILILMIISNAATVALTLFVGRSYAKDARDAANDADASVDTMRDLIETPVFDRAASDAAGLFAEGGKNN